MRKQRFYFSLCLACLLISACVSKEKYEELEATLAGTQAKLEQKGQAVEELTQKLGELETGFTLRFFMFPRNQFAVAD